MLGSRIFRYFFYSHQFLNLKRKIQNKTKKKQKKKQTKTAWSLFIFFFIFIFDAFGIELRSIYSQDQYSFHLTIIEFLTFIFFTDSILFFKIKAKNKRKNRSALVIYDSEIHSKILTTFRKTIHTFAIDSKQSIIFFD